MLPNVTFKRNITSRARAPKPDSSLPPGAVRLSKETIVLNGTVHANGEITFTRINREDRFKTTPSNYVPLKLED